MSWHNFFFAAFDPAATITLDKLPGAFWLQALSVRIFGVHAWALVAPQVVEGMASVLVLYRVVRRLSGPLAAIVAAGVLVFSPATVALNRGNISDTLMVLLLLLAADATVSAVISGRSRSLIWAGVFVGLAFQAKMIEAWLVLPAFALAYLTGAACGLGSAIGAAGDRGAGRRRCFARVDGSRLTVAGARTALCRWQPHQFDLQPGVRLQRAGSAGSAIAQPAVDPVDRIAAQLIIAGMGSPVDRVAGARHRLADPGRGHRTCGLFAGRSLRT